MPYKERSVEKLYFSIGEVAEQLGVNTSVIRYWEKEFGVLRPRRDSKGDRSYTQQDIRKVRMIQYLLKDRGFTINGAREHLKGGTAQSEGQTELRDRLVRIRGLLAELGKRLGSM